MTPRYQTRWTPAGFRRVPMSSYQDVISYSLKTEPAEVVFSEEELKVLDEEKARLARRTGARKKKATLTVP